MAQQNINIGSSANKGDGDPIRTAFTKVNTNFTELYNRVVVAEGQLGIDNAGGATIQQSIIGSVFADDSTLLIDGANGSIPAANITGTLPALDGSALTNLPAQAFASITGKPTTLAGYGITDGTSNASPTFTGAVDFTGATSVDFTGATITGTSFLTSVPAQSFASLTGKPTTIAGYGITDAFDGAFGSLSGTPTTLAGFGITDAATLNNMAPTGAVDFTGATSVDFTGATITGTSFLTSYTETDPVVGAITGIVKADGSGNISAAVAGTDYSTFDGAFSSLTGKPTTLAGYGITDAANTSAETTFTADVKFDTGVEEKFATLTGSTGVVAHDCDNGHVFYHTGAAGDITANFTNLGLTAEYATNLTVIINQGATPYEVTAVQIGGAAQTINWQGGSQPTGNANGIDSFSFTILNDGGSFVVLGQMVDFT